MTELLLTALIIFLTLYKGDTKLKYFMLRPKFDTTNGKVLSVDT